MTASNQKRGGYRSVSISSMINSKTPDGIKSLRGRLNNEILDIYEKIKLSPEEVAERNEVFMKFKNLIEGEFECTVEPYGSFKTDLQVFDSDLDLTVLIQDKDQEKQNVNAILAKISAIIEAAGVSDTAVVHIRNARTPILKCKHKGVKVDISINKDDAIRSAEFVVETLRVRPYLKIFLLLLKYFLKRRNLSETLKGGLCSYGQFLLLLSFFQLHPLVQEKRINVKKNLGTLFMEFFQFYGREFPFEKSVISVTQVKYKPNREGSIFIEDPVTPGHNVANGCTALHMVRDVFIYSFKIMSAVFQTKVAPGKAIGSLWIRLNDDEMRIRNKRS